MSGVGGRSRPDSHGQTGLQGYSSIQRGSALCLPGRASAPHLSPPPCICESLTHLMQGCHHLTLFAPLWSVRGWEHLTYAIWSQRPGTPPPPKPGRQEHQSQGPHWGSPFCRSCCLDGFFSSQSDARVLPIFKIQVLHSFFADQIQGSSGQPYPPPQGSVGEGSGGV